MQLKIVPFSINFDKQKDRLRHEIFRNKCMEFKHFPSRALAGKSDKRFDLKSRRATIRILIRPKIAYKNFNLQFKLDVKTVAVFFHSGRKMFFCIKTSSRLVQYNNNNMKNTRAFRLSDYSFNNNSNSLSKRDEALNVQNLKKGSTKEYTILARL